MLTAKTILGAGWMVSSRLAGRLIDFVTVLVLARTLTPADFGLTALAMTLTGVVDMVLEVPLIQALTRLPSIEKPHLDTAFTLGVVRGAALSLIVVVAAWPFAHIYNDERLVALVAAIAIGPVARSLYSPAMVGYVRQMNFRELFIAELLGKIAAFVAGVSIAYRGGGYWAIAAASISASITTTVVSYLLAPYRPALSLSRFREFSTLLGWFSSAQLVSALSWQFDRALLGYFVTKSDLGQYTMASDLSVFPTQSLVGPAMQPVMAAFSRINDDRARLRNAYLRASRIAMMLAAPACIGMALTSDLIVDVLLGPKWTEAAVFLKWLALATALSAFYQPVHSLAFALNRTNVIFRLSVVELCCRIVLMSLGLYFYSLMGVVAARGALSVIMFILSSLAARYLADTSMTSEIGNLWKVAAACAVMTLAVLVLRYELTAIHLNVLVDLALVSALGAAVYAGTLYVLGVRFRGLVTAAG